MKRQVFINNPFAHVQKLACTTLCVVSIILCWSCQFTNEEDLPLAEPVSDEMIASDLSENGETDPKLLIGEWDPIMFACTADGRKISNVAAIASNYAVTISDLTFIYNDNLLGPLYFVNCVFFYSRSDNLISYLEEKSLWYAVNMPVTDVERKIFKALSNAYSFVIKGNELIIFFTGVENNNLLILKKR